MMIIKTLTDIIKENIREARHYIDEAYRVRDQSPAVAHWYKTMAQNHIDFNTEGHQVVTDIIKAKNASDGNNELTAGMMAVYKQIHADLVAEQAETSAMISAFK